MSKTSKTAEETFENVGSLSCLSSILHWCPPDLVDIVFEYYRTPFIKPLNRVHIQRWILGEKIKKKFPSFEFGDVIGSTRNYLTLYCTDSEDNSRPYAVKFIQVLDNDMAVCSRVLKQSMLWSENAADLAQSFIAPLRRVEQIREKTDWNSGTLLVTCLDYFAEGSLCDVLNSMPACPEEKLLYNWLHCLATALEKLKSLNIVHGNLKPRNILVRKDKLYLADTLTNALTQHSIDSSQSGGSFLYWGPEQETIRDSDEWTPAMDMWAVGSVLFEIVTKHKPNFRGLGVEEKLKRVMPQCPADVKWLILKMLTLEPKERMTATELRLFCADKLPKRSA